MNTPGVNVHCRFVYIVCIGSVETAEVTCDGWCVVTSGVCGVIPLIFRVLDFMRACVSRV